MKSSTPAASIALATINLYRNYISNNMLHVCRFTPSCSVYAEEAIQKYGFIRGVWLMLGRIVRCQPFCRAGADPVL